MSDLRRIEGQWQWDTPTIHQSHYTEHGITLHGADGQTRL